MREYNPSLRQDVRQVARKTGASAGAWFWGILTGIMIVFWPSIFVHGPHRVLAEWLWYGFLVLLIASFYVAARMPDHPKPPVPRWKPPDLRESDVFDGIR